MDNLIQDINSIEEKLVVLDDKSLEEVLYTLIGVTMIQIQKSEFSMLGTISHIRESLLKTDNLFKDLNPTRFLSSQPSDKKYRRQTLGQIIGFLKENLRIFNADALEDYLSKRNNFIHNFWRNHLNNKSDKVAAARFVISVFRDSLKWDSVFKGFLYIYLKSIKEQYKNIVANADHLEPHFQTFLDAVMENKDDS
jgi:hypothetical protein